MSMPYPTYSSAKAHFTKVKEDLDYNRAVAEDNAYIDACRSTDPTQHGLRLGDPAHSRKVNGITVSCSLY